MECAGRPMDVVYETTTKSLITCCRSLYVVLTHKTRETVMMDIPSHPALITSMPALRTAGLGELETSSVVLVFRQVQRKP